MYLRDYGDTEVGGFGISRAIPCDDDDLLFVEDVRLVRQRSTPVSIQLDDIAVADFFDEQVDQGRRPEQFARIWIHSHPGESATPSDTDEETFSRCFGNADWAVMFILARGGETFARLRFNVGPGGSIEIPVEIDFSRPFPATDHSAWEKEYADTVQPVHDWPTGHFQKGLEPWDGDLHDTLAEEGLSGIGETHSVLEEEI